MIARINFVDHPPSVFSNVPQIRTESHNNTQKNQGRRITQHWRGLHEKQTSPLKGEPILSRVYKSDDGYFVYLATVEFRQK